MVRPQLARVERFKTISYAHMATNARAVLPCGCSIFAGQRLDNAKATTGALPCCEPHQAIVDRANELLREAASHPRRMLLVAACADALTRAAAEIRAGAGDPHQLNGRT